MGTEGKQSLAMIKIKQCVTLLKYIRTNNKTLRANRDLSYFLCVMGSVREKPKVCAISTIEFFYRNVFAFASLLFPLNLL